MQWLASLCVKRPVFASVLILALTVVGGFSFMQLGIDRFPTVDFPTIVVTTRLPGAAPEQVESEITDIVEEAVNTITVDRIQKRVAEHYDIRIADMTSKRRPANIAGPRQIAMYLSRSLLKSSYSEIGDAFGGRDHGTVMHACRQVRKKMDANPEMRRTVGLLETMIRSNRDA